MADEQTTTKGDTKIVADVNKTPEQYIKEAENLYIVPATVRTKFPDLIKLIYETKSMDDDEREYWLQIMPVMSEEQIVKFRDIMVNEKNELSKIDAKKPAPIPVPELNEKAIKARMDAIRANEARSEQAEKSEEEKLLAELEGL